MTSIAIIGTGWGARVQVPAFRAAGFEIAGIAGSNPERTRKIAADHGVAPFDDWRELISRPDVDLVSIVTPPSRHEEMAVASLQAGRNVLCEKPTAMNAAEAMRMYETAMDHPARLALIDHELRFLPSWIEAKRRLPSLGALRYAEIRYSSGSRGDRSRAWNWWSDREEGGGVLGAVGSHCVDTIRYVAGEIVQVRALLHTFIAERPAGDELRRVTADDFATFSAVLDSGALATVSLSVVAGRDDETSFTFHCEEGALSLVEDRLLETRRGGEWTTVVSGSGQRLTGDSSGGYFGTGTHLFARALRRRLDGDHHATAPAATFADGVAQQQILDAVRHSASENGAPRDVPPPPLI